MNHDFPKASPPVIALCDQFSVHLLGHEWETVIAAFAISLLSAMQCHGARCGVPMPDDVREFLSDIVAFALEQSSAPTRES